MPSAGGAPEVGVKSILIASDFSEASHKPLHHPLTTARHFGAKFYLVHVVSSVGLTIAGPEASKLATKGAQRDAQKLEQRLLESGALTGLHHEFIVSEGDVWEQLERVFKQNDVDLVVTGTHVLGGLGKLLLGYVAERIFRSADCFVVTVGPGSYKDSLIEKSEAVCAFLLTMDFGAASLRALPTRSHSPINLEQN